MGRIRGKNIKNLAKKLVENYPEKFNNKFEDNKKSLDELALLRDKPIRNKVAGYIINVVKRNNKIK
jgi:small subunit ribosomal protein S17e